MVRTLQVLNRLKGEGVIGEYAIGGAMGATFYLEPILTFDLDVFVALPVQGALLTLAPLYEALRRHGHTESGECVDIEGVPVQFLPVHNPLLVEALDQAVETVYEGTPTRVFRAEHLVAICVQTGRAKDRERVRRFREEASLNTAHLAGILQKYGLEEKWRQWTT